MPLLRGNLHAHTTFSDGIRSPAALGEEYERREGQGSIVGQRGGQPQAVVLPPILDGTERDVPEGCDRHGLSLIHKVAPMDHAHCSTLGKSANSLQLRLENSHAI